MSDVTNDTTPQHLRGRIAPPYSGDRPPPNLTCVLRHVVNGRQQFVFEDGSVWWSDLDYSRWSLALPADADQNPDTITILRRDLEIAVFALKSILNDVDMLFAGYERKLASWNDEREALSRLEEALKQ